ncbi:MAG: discoidin domain-containing protein [Chloroflexi bacterium]|nr:MAG: discoidin domain-containing protein [Chloroflexota bacterium]
MKPTTSPQHQQWDEEVIKILKRLGSFQIEYPSELFATRRAAFILQVEQQDTGRIKDGLVPEEQLIQHLESLKSVQAEYPRELLAARRAAFVDQVEQYNRAEITEELYSQDQEIIKLLRNLKAVETEYPPNLMAARREAFRRQVASEGRTSILDALRTSIRSLLLYKFKPLSMPTMNMMRTSLVVIVLMLATFVGSLLRSPVQPLASSTSEGNVSQPGPISAVTSTGEVATVICKPGYLPPLCLAKEFDKSEDLTFQGNGSARPAVAKDTLPGFSGVHKAAYVNDGLYGPGASWISNSAYSWIKIDLGKTTTINTVEFGRDRLGSFNDRDPGQFIIAVALSDNVYADGNSNNDYVEYTEIYNSEQAGFNGVVSGSETIRAQFGPVTARFVKIIFSNAGTAVDEIEVFMVQPPVLASQPTRKPNDDVPGIDSPPLFVNTPMPTNTPRPIPTNTALPTNTPIPPTNTPQPTNTPLPPPTNTPLPPTDPPPTDTSVPPTQPPPTNPPPADTSIPPTDSVPSTYSTEPVTAPSEISVLVEP